MSDTDSLPPYDVIINHQEEDGEIRTTELKVEPNPPLLTVEQVRSIIEQLQIQESPSPSPTPSPSPVQESTSNPHEERRVRLQAQIDLVKSKIKIIKIVKMIMYFLCIPAIFYTIYSIIYSFILYKEVKEDDNCPSKSDIPYFLLTIGILKSIASVSFPLEMYFRGRGDRYDYSSDCGEFIMMLITVFSVIGVSIFVNPWAVGESFRTRNQNCYYDSLLFIRINAIVDISLLILAFYVCVPIYESLDIKEAGLIRKIDLMKDEAQRYYAITLV